MSVTNGHSAVNGSAVKVPAATKLRELIRTSDFIVAPGVYEGFSARIALEVGFDCLYMVRSFRRFCSSSFCVLKMSYMLTCDL
jgi:hypothetical protein